MADLIYKFEHDAMDNATVLEGADREMAVDLINKYARHIDRSVYKVTTHIPSTKDLTFTFVAPSNIWDREDIIRWVCYGLSRQLSQLGCLMQIRSDGNVRFYGPVITISLWWA